MVKCYQQTHPWIGVVGKKKPIKGNMDQITEEITEFIKNVATLFSLNIESMDQLDAADFKDRAGKIWDLVETARQLQQKD